MKCNLFEGRDSGKMTVIQKWVYKLPCSDVVTQMLLDQGVFIAQKKFIDNTSNTWANHEIRGMSSLFI